MRDVEPEDPMFLMDPFAIHRQQMNRMLSGGFGYSPFLSITDGSIPGARPASRRMQVMVMPLPQVPKGQVGGGAFVLALKLTWQVEPCLGKQGGSRKKALGSP